MSLKYYFEEPTDEFADICVTLKSTLHKNEKMLKRIARLKSIKYKKPEWLMKILNSSEREITLQNVKINKMLQKVDIERSLRQ